MMKTYLYILLFSGLIMLYACSPAGGNSRGHEFMPDMVHSTAVEANIYNYYYYNTWGEEGDYKETVKPRKPVNGTVPRGYTALHYAEDQKSRLTGMTQFTGEGPESDVRMTPNGSVPYYYGDSEEERLRATAEIIENPYPITAKGLEKGKELYEIFCGICHGNKGDGLGYLVRDPDPVTGDPGGAYPAAPANFLLDEFVDASNGRYYHSIMWGKNVMGAYKDKLSYEERWQVIHYIRALQAKDKGLAYNETENTLNDIEVPGARLLARIEAEKAAAEQQSDNEVRSHGTGDAHEMQEHEGEHH